MPPSVTVAGVQMDVRLGAVEENLRRIEAFLREAAGAGARLVVFPECALSGYCFESLEEARACAQPVPGPATQRLSEVCREVEAFAVVGMLEADGPRVFNACVLLGPAGVVRTYRKIHLPLLGVDRFTTPGDRPLAVDDLGEFRVGMNICYDGAFPECARVMALQGADLVVLPTNWPPGAQCASAHMIATRAMENAIYYLAVDRVGTERDTTFLGGSKLCDPVGRELAAADAVSETILYGQIDPQNARQKRRVRVPGKNEVDRIGDRRPEFYTLVTQPRQTG